MHGADDITTLNFLSRGFWQVVSPQVEAYRSKPNCPTFYYHLRNSLWAMLLIGPVGYVRGVKTKELCMTSAGSQSWWLVRPSIVRKVKLKKLWSKMSIAKSLFLKVKKCKLGGRASESNTSKRPGFESQQVVLCKNATKLGILAKKFSGVLILW